MSNEKKRTSRWVSIGKYPAWTIRKARKEYDRLYELVHEYGRDPVAEKQAVVGGHAVLEEVLLLTVHGTLHLLGFDHNTQVNKEKMWAAQGQVMAELGLAHVLPTEA